MEAFASIPKGASSLSFAKMKSFKIYFPSKHSFLIPIQMDLRHLIHGSILCNSSKCNTERAREGCGEQVSLKSLSNSWKREEQRC